MYVLNHRFHEVETVGYKCSKKLVKLLNEENFLGAKYSSETSQYVELSREQCHQMVKTRMCGDEKMICKGSKCWHNQLPRKEFQWFSKVSQTGKICEFETVKIVAKNKNALL